MKWGTGKNPVPHFCAFAAIAGRLCYNKQHKLNTADALTLCHIAGTLLLAFLRPLSAGFFGVYALAGLTDVLDGWIARKTKTASDFGAPMIPGETYAKIVNGQV